MRDMGQITVGNPQICAPWQFDGRNATIARADGSNLRGRNVSQKSSSGACSSRRTRAHPGSSPVQAFAQIMRRLRWLRPG